MAVAQDMLRRPAVCGAKIHTIIMASNLNCLYNIDAVGAPDGAISRKRFVMVVVEELNYATAAVRMMLTSTGEVQQLKAQ